MLLFLDAIPYITIFIFGITIGSFLNVCIYRGVDCDGPFPLYDLWAEASVV